MIKQVGSMAVAALLLAAPAYARQVGGNDPNAPRATSPLIAKSLGEDPNAPRTQGDNPNAPRGVEA